MKSKDNIFTHYYKNIIEHSSKQFLEHYVLETTTLGIFPSENELHANQFKLTEVVNKNHRWIQNFYQNRYHVANICERFDSTYDV